MIGESKSMTMVRPSNTSIRHTVRNLRAKVRTLVPNQICCRYEKRNHDIATLSENKKTWRHVTFQKRWRIGKQLKDEYFYDKKADKCHLFSKLKPEEVQQINEDKMYYLGTENHAEVYDQFVFENYPHESVGLARYGLRISEEDSKKPREKKLFGNMSTKDFSSKKILTPPSKKIKNWTHTSTPVEKGVSNHTEISLQKRKFVCEEQKAQSAYYKMRIEQKQERAGTIFRENRNQVYSQYKQRQEREINRKKEAIAKKSKLQKKGEISALNTEVRKLFISRLSGGWQKNL